MRNIVTLAFMLWIGLFVGEIQLYAQGQNCANAEPFCTDLGLGFPAGVNNGVAETGNNYGCLFTFPNPAWYYLQIAEAGNIVISETNSNNIDIDYALWGPWPSLPAALANCGSLGAPIDCSYLPQATEIINVPGGNSVGDVYLLLVTNFGNSATDVFAEQIGGTGSTDCNILIPCSIESVEAGPPVEICLGEPSFAFQGSQTGATGFVNYEWTANPSEGLDFLFPGPYSATPFLDVSLIPSTYSGDIVFTLTATEVTNSGEECPLSDDFTMTIISTPDAIPVNNGPYCAGEVFELEGYSNYVGADITFVWTGPDGYYSEEPYPSDATEFGEYFLSVGNSQCTSQPVATEIEMNDVPDVVASNDGPYCPGQTIELMGSTSGSGGSVMYQWTGPTGYSSSNQNPTDATEFGEYSLVVNIDGCESDPQSTTVEAALAPTVTASNGGPYCAGETFSLEATTADSGTSVVYNWTGPDSYVSTSQNPTDATEFGEYELSLNIDGCVSAPVTTTIEQSPDPTADFTLDSEVCADGTSNATASYTGTADPGTATFNWDFGGGTANPTGGESYSISWNDAGAGSATVSLTVSENGCDSEPFSTTIDLANPLDIPVLSCGLATINSVEFLWDPINGATEYDLSITTPSGSSTTSVTTTSYTESGLDQGDEVSLSITAVGPAPCGNSEMASLACTAENCPADPIDIGIIPAEICIDASPISLTESPAGVVISGQGVTANMFDPSGLDPALSPFTISFDYTDPDDCVYFQTFDITVLPLPTSTFSVDPLIACSDGSSSVTATYTGSATTAATYTWDFDGGVASPLGGESYSVVWGTPGDKTISLIVTENSCVSESSTELVSVTDPMPAPTVLCGSSTTSTVSFTWEAVSGASDYTLDVSGDTPSVSETITATTYEVTGLSIGATVTVSVIANGSAPCGNSPAGSQSCTALDCPSIVLSIDNLDPNYCSDQAMILLEATPAGGSFSGPGVTADGLSFDPSTADVGGVVLYEYTDPSNDCDYSISQPVVVNTVPDASFILNAASICNDGSTPVLLDFTGAASPTAIFDWDFAGGTATPDANFGDQSLAWLGVEGDVTVSLSINDNGCISTPVTQQISLSLPLAAPVPICAGSTTDSANFEWLAIEGADSYSISYSVNGDTPVNDSTTELVYSIEGLNVNDEIDFDVLAVGTGACGNSPSGLVTCFTDNCADISLSILGNDPVYCADVAPVILSLEPAGGILSGNGVVLADQFDPSLAGAGTHALTYTYIDPTTDCSYNTSIQIEVSPIPVASFSLPAQICSDATSTVNLSFDGTVVDVSTALFTWDFGSANSSPEPDGSYTLSFDSNTAITETITLEIEENGCVSNVFTQTIDLIPPLVAPNPSCDESSTSTVSISWAAVDGADAYNIDISGASVTAYSDQTTDLEYEVSGLSQGDMVNFVVTAISAAICGDSPSSVEVSCEAQNCPADPIDLSSNATEICEDASLLGLVATPTGGTWSGSGVSGSDFDPATVTVGDGPFILSYAYTDATTDCSYSQNFSLTLNGVPSSDFTLNNSEACLLGGTVVVTYTGSASATANYTWDFGGATAAPLGAESYDLSFDTAGSIDISLQVEENGCESAITSQTIIVSNPLDAPIVNCGASTLNTVSFDWSLIEIAAAYEVRLSGAVTSIDTVDTNSYEVTGLSQLDEVSIEVVALGPAPCGNSLAGSATCIALDCPAVDVTFQGLATNYCLADSENSIAALPAGGSFSIDGNPVTSINPSDLGTGSYTLNYEYTDDQGCPYFASEDFFVSSVGVTAIADTTVLPGTIIDLEAQGFSALNGDLSFNWSSNTGDVNGIVQPSTSVVPLSTTTYEVYASDSYGCSESTSVTITVLAENSVIAPNAFSPNNDGQNDMFKVLGTNVKTVELRIFNRWGQEVYYGEANEASENVWDGRFKGNETEVGVYVYTAIVTFLDDTEEKIKGNITLIR